VAVFAATLAHQPAPTPADMFAASLIQQQNTLQLSLPTSLGEIIYLRSHLDQLKHKYKKIDITFMGKKLWDHTLYTGNPEWPQKEKKLNDMLNDLGNLLFSEAPFSFKMNQEYPFSGDIIIFCQKYNLDLIKPNLSNILCAGKPLQIGEYVVITTKIREIDNAIFTKLAPQLWNVLSKIAKKYTIVVLGEKKVERRKEYDIPSLKNKIYGIYNEIISCLPNNNFLDLTVDALGETVNTLKDIRQDCLIMNQAKAVITLGIGGNCSLASACANNHIGFRDDKRSTLNILFGKPESKVFSSWEPFIKTLEGL
jgi:hypothetical protein